MELGEIFKDSFNYSVSDWPKLLILGVLCVLSQLSAILMGGFGFNAESNFAVSFLLSIIALICSLLIGGYGLSIIRDTLASSDMLPEFDMTSNFVDGIKLLILGIVYFIIPAIIAGIVFFATGGAESLGTILIAVNETGNLTTVSNSVVGSFLQSGIISTIVAAVLFFIFGLLALAAEARLAKTGSLGNALNFITSFRDIGEIGWGKYFIWYVILAIIGVIIVIISLVVGIIPVIGLIVDALILRSFLTIFHARSLGLVYSDA